MHEGTYRNTKGAQNEVGTRVQSRIKELKVVSLIEKKSISAVLKLKA